MEIPSGDISERSDLEMRRTHSGFDGAYRMLDGLPATNASSVVSGHDTCAPYHNRGTFVSFALWTSRHLHWADVRLTGTPSATLEAIWHDRHNQQSTINRHQRKGSGYRAAPCEFP